MEINYLQQQKYSPNKFRIYLEENGVFEREVDYDEIDLILRDISYVREQSTDYLYLYGGQFNFRTLLNLPYWEYLFLKGDIGEYTLKVLEDGILLIIALFYVEIYDDEGNYYLSSNNMHEVVKKALYSYQPKQEKNIKTLEKIKYLESNWDNDAVLRRIEPTEESINIEKEIKVCSHWIYDELVINFYRRIIHDNDNPVKNPLIPKQKD